MALKNRVTGRYLKVVREAAVFTPKSVQVTFYDFVSKGARDEYFSREAAVKKFLVECDKKCCEFDAKILAGLRECGFAGDESTIPDSIKELISVSESFKKDVAAVRFGWNRQEALPSFSNQSLLDDCGFDSKWRVPMEPWGLSTVHTDIYRGQTFSYSTLYAELKKVFKADYIDC